MASITLTVPDAQVQRIVTAVASKIGVNPAQFTTGAQQAAFIKSVLSSFLIGLITDYESSQVAINAAQNQQQNVINQIPIT